MSYTFVGGFTANAATLSASPTIPAGPVVVVVFNEHAVAPTVTVNGTVLTNNLFSTTTELGIFSGTVSAGSSLSITGGAAFKDLTCAVWRFTDASLTFGVAHTSTTNTISISVTAGQYMFGAAFGGSDTVGNFSGSTQAPSGDRTVAGADGTGEFVDWTIASTNASFSATSTSYSNVIVGTFTSGGGGGGGGANDDTAAIHSGATQSIVLMRERISGLFEPVREIIKPERRKLLTPGFSF